MEAPFHVASSLPQFEQPHLYARELSKEPNYIKFKVMLKKAIEDIISSEKYESIFMYTHGGVIKTALRIIHDNDCVCYTINNCSVTKITWEKSRWHINFINMISFLPKEYVS